MAKYIRAHAMKINIDFNTDEITRTAPTDILMRIIDEIEAPDGVDIVFCKDCKWFDIDGIHGRPLDGHEVCNCKKFYGYPMRDDEYCSRAERRESE